MATCRYCKEHMRDGAGVKYSTRHYAHYRCYLLSGKLLSDLHDWQIVMFPARLIHEFSLDHIADPAWQREDHRIQQIED